MADTAYHFRNALGGFHKGDVTGYIEKTATQHRAELLEYEKTITTLREENRSLQQQLNILMMSTPLPSMTASAPIPEPVAEPEPAPAPEPAPEPESAPASVPTDSCELVSMELQAYRRAEAVERKANNRAKKLYVQMEDLCEDALDEFRTTDSAVKQTIEVILAQANALEQSYQTLSSALNASREKLASMNAQLSGSDDVSQDE